MMRGQTRRDALIGLAALAGLGTGLGIASLAKAGGSVSDTRLSMLPFDLPPQNALSMAKRKVVAHWHYFPRSFDNRPAGDDQYARDFMSADGSGGIYRSAGGFVLERPLPRPPIASADWQVRDMATDAREASAIGVDAFQMNFTTLEHYGWQYFLKMQQAILEEQLSLLLMPNIDCTLKPAQKYLTSHPEAIVAAFRRGGLMTTPDGRLMLSAFMAEAWPAEYWSAMLGNIRKLGVEVQFIPMFLDLGKVTPAQLALTDVVSTWSGNRIGAVQAFALYSRLKFAPGKPWMAPIFPQDCRPKEGWYNEAGGSEMFRASWMAAIAMDAAIADIVTWNDYSESSEIRPSTGIQYGFYDLAAYYIAWYKMGSPPQIRRDALYYFHRVESATASGLGTAQPHRMEMRHGPGPLNEIELVAFLAEPGVISITAGGNTVSKAVSAGVQVLKAPLAPGRPNFRLERNGQQVIFLESAFTVRERSAYQDLLYRAGSSNRAPVEDLAQARG